MEFRILGPVQVIDDAGRQVVVGGEKQRALLALLLLHANELVSSGRLIEELWGERAPASAGKTLQVHVSRLRRVLTAGGMDGAALATGPGGYVLQLPRDELDATVFEGLLEQGRALSARGDPSGAAARLREALGLWHGSALADLALEEFAQPEIRRLAELRLVAVIERIDADLALGAGAELVGEIEKLIASNPLQERLRGQLMRALYRAGRQADALEVYRQTSELLRDQLGLEPSPALQSLERLVLQQDASLEPSAAGVAGVDAHPALGLGGSGRPGSAAAGDVAAGEVRDVSVPAGRRKVVTALFCDVTGSTALGEELDPEALVGVMSAYFRQLRATIERHGGTVDKFIGDAVMAVFGIPVVREDDALRAVRAAAEIRERLPLVAEEVGVALSFRTAVNTGLVLVGVGENLAVGDAINIAARLEQAAAPGEILLGEETLSLVRDAVQVEPLEPLVLKGKSEAVPAFRLLGVDPVAPGLARHLDVPLVGRDRELAVLLAAWDATLQESGCHLFTLLGVAGVGKSRLVAELLGGVGEESVVLSGRCLHYGEGITFWPLLEALRPVGEPARQVLDHLGGGGAATAEELFLEVRRLLESLALQRPVILHVDDLQWAEPMLLDLLDHVVDLSRGVPILLLCTARPELIEDRPAWGGGKLNATTVLLEPLPAEECELLLSQLGDGLSADARARVISASEGNPLFLEEMAALAREPGGSRVRIPSTIQALLAARLERLPATERELLERGAVEGEVFHRRAVRALAGEPPSAEQPGLASLVRKDLIRPHPASLQGDDAFRFRHLLVRDAAYDGLPKATRARLHERFASWLENNARELAELDEIAGWHLEQAVRYRRELGEAVVPELARRAAEHLQMAGRRAAGRIDAPAARNLLERSLAVAPKNDPLRTRIELDLAEQLVTSGEHARADALISDVEGDPDASTSAALTRFEWLVNARPQAATHAIDSRLPAMLEQLARAGDERGIAKAHLAAFWVHWLASRGAPATEQVRLAAKHAQIAGDDRLRARALGLHVLALMDGPTPAGAIAEELDAIEQDASGPGLLARVKVARGEVERLNGRFAEARRLTQNAIEDFRALGDRSNEDLCYQRVARIARWESKPTEALATLLRSDAIQLELGQVFFRSTTQAELARTYELLGDRVAARSAIELAEQLTAPEDAVNYAITHAVRAQLALADDDRDVAERWARSAVDHAQRTDFPEHQADAKLELARVLAALGRPEEAIAEARAALAVSEAKGDRPRVGQARALLEELSDRA